MPIYQPIFDIFNAYESGPNLIDMFYFLSEGIVPSGVEPNAKLIFLSIGLTQEMIFFRHVPIVMLS